MGTRINADGRILAYTGDTGPSENVEKLGRGADLLITEASWQQAPEGIEPLHLTARQAGEHARRAEARQLLLSHFWPTDDRDRSREQAAEAFEGEMTMAEEGLRIEVGS
jgi:ribonuclease BN (tRNA processing enzyme)